jgi:hypothetical protein
MEIICVGNLSYSRLGIERFDEINKEQLIKDSRMKELLIGIIIQNAPHSFFNALTGLTDAARNDW